jgi:hypothetical protein
MKTLRVSVGHVPGLINRRNWDDAAESAGSRVDGVSLLWLVPSEERSLPHAIVIDDARFTEVAALLTTHSELLSPLTSYVRLVPESGLEAFKQRVHGSDKTKRDALACVGLVIAEALLQRGLADSSSDVPLSACFKTLSWTLGRFHLHGGSGSQVDVAARWSTVWDILREDRLSVGPGDTLEVWSALFGEGDSPKLPLPLQSDAGILLDILRRSRAQIDEIWKRLADVSSVAHSFRLSEKQSREERYQMLSRANDELAATGRLGEPIGRAILGLYAAACVDFSLAAITLLPVATPQAARLWAGLFAGAAKVVGPRREESGLESRLEALFEAEKSVSARTTADIGFEELMMLRRTGSFRTDELRLKSPTEVAVELIPGLISTFSTSGKRAARRREPLRGREREIADLLLQVERATESLRRVISSD